MGVRVEIIIATKREGAGLQGLKDDFGDVGKAVDNAGRHPYHHNHVLGADRQADL